MSIRNYLKKNEQILSIYRDAKYFYSKSQSNDKEFLKKQFKKVLGRELDFENPHMYNDKLQWLKINWYDPLATKCADKYEVRGFVEDRIGKGYLNVLYGVYDSVDEIDIEKLPNSFVLKGTHGSGFNLICKDKNEVDWDKAFKKMRKWLKKNYYWINREWVYKDIKPRIVCEKYLEEFDSKQLKDYKFFCFNGVPKLIQVDFDRFSGHKRNIYDLDWNLTNLEIIYPRDENSIINKPQKLDKMVELCEKLSMGFPHVRVDLYALEDDEILFGELTFFHEGGLGRFSPIEFEVEMGEWVKLPKKVN